MAEPISVPPLFRRVPDELWMQTLAQADLIRAEKGSVVYDRTRLRRCLGAVLRGRVQVRRDALLMSTLEAGDVFGAAALFGGEEYPTTLTALTACEALLIPQERVRRLLRSCGDFAEDYAAYLSGRIRFLSQRLEAVSSPSNRGKLAQYLLANAGAGGALTLSATQLCQRLGVGRATLYRAFAGLEAAGAIAREGKTIRVLDAGRLRTCCEHEKEGRSI